MVAGAAANERLEKKVAEIYAWIEAQITDDKMKAQCSACGKCCDFDSFDHRLFITPPELMYLSANIGKENVRTMTTGRCPYNVEDKCTVYEYRFAACRIFYCGGEADFQGELSELTLEKLKSICTEFKIPYCYSKLASSLKAFADI